MGIGFASNHNFNEFLKMSKKIDAIFAQKVEAAARLCADEGGSMLREFRETQYASPYIPYPVITRKRKGKQKKDDPGDMGAAVAYAASHAGGAPLLAKGVPWINRTFRAARSVQAYVEKTPVNISVGLYHTMPYGAYLEFAYNRKYAVIEPIVRRHFPVLREKLLRLFRG